MLDNQSACNVIINIALLANIRKCEWTLRLQTQAGECVIDEVGDLKGVGTAWFYPNGVANTLSQFRMIAYSKWRMTYDTGRFHRSGDIANLFYDATTPQGFKCKFSLTAQGLHAHEMKRRDNNIFGTQSVDNVTIFGGDCHVLLV